MIWRDDSSLTMVADSPPVVWRIAYEMRRIGNRLTFGEPLAYPVAILSLPPMSEPNESYIGRKAAAEKYRRGERTLERDISQALKLHNQKFLGNIRLRTKEGDLLPGTEVTFEKIDELKNSGQVPTWEIAEAYLAERYGLRSEESQDNKGSQQPEEGTQQEPTRPQESSSLPTNEPGLPPLPRDPVEQAALLKALYQDLQHSFRDERERNDKIFALIETIPKQQEQTNVLLREFQQLMKSGNTALALPVNLSVETPKKPQVVEAQTIETSKVMERGVTEPNKSPGVKKQVSKKTIKKRAAKPAKKKSPAKPPATPKNRPAKKRSFWKQDVRDFFRR